MADFVPTDEKLTNARAPSAASDGPAMAASAGDSPAASNGSATKPDKASAKTTAALGATPDGSQPLVKRGRGRPPKSAAEKAATIALRKRLRQGQATRVPNSLTRPLAERPAATSRPATSARSASRPARPQSAFPKIERNPTVNFDSSNLFAGFGAVPGSERFQAMFLDVNAKSQEAIAKSSKLAEEMVGIAKGNVEALVTSSRIAAAGAQAIGKEAAELGKQGIEQASAAIRGFAEAKSPTELMQLQSDYARAAFDRMVSNSSKMTEALVKFAGEAFEPLSSRASVNAERFNSITA